MSDFNLKEGNVATTKNEKSKKNQLGDTVFVTTGQYGYYSARIVLDFEVKTDANGKKLYMVQWDSTRCNQYVPEDAIDWMRRSYGIVDKVKVPTARRAQRNKNNDDVTINQRSSWSCKNDSGEDDNERQQLCPRSVQQSNRRNQIGQNDVSSVEAKCINGEIKNAVKQNLDRGDGTKYNEHASKLFLEETELNGIVPSGQCIASEDHESSDGALVHTGTAICNQLPITARVYNRDGAREKNQSVMTNGVKNFEQFRQWNLEKMKLTSSCESNEGSLENNLKSIHKGDKGEYIYKYPTDQLKDEHTFRSDRVNELTLSRKGIENKSNLLVLSSIHHQSKKGELNKFAPNQGVTNNETQKLKSMLEISQKKHQNIGTCTSNKLQRTETTSCEDKENNRCSNNPPHQQERGKKHLAHQRVGDGTVAQITKKLKLGKSRNACSTGKRTGKSFIPPMALLFLNKCNLVYYYSGCNTSDVASRYQYRLADCSNEVECDIIYMKRDEIEEGIALRIFVEVEHAFV